MKTVYKYEIPIDDRSTIRMPEGAVLLSLQHVPTVARKPTTSLTLWALVDPDPSVDHVDRTFVVCGTGQEVPEDAKVYLETVQCDFGLVWHVFEVARS